MSGIPDPGGVSGTFSALERTTPIVQSAEGALTTTSMRIANGTQVQHKNVMELVRANISDLEEFALVAFETRPRPEGQHGGGDVQVAILTEEHATLLLTYMRNSDVVRDFKKRLVREFYEMRRALSERAAKIPTLTPLEYARRLVDAEERAEAEAVKARTLEAAIERDAPLVAKAEAHTASDRAIHRQEFAREVQAWAQKIHGIFIKHQQVYEFLGFKGMTVRGNRTDAGHATAHAVTSGWAWTDKGTTEDGYPYATTRLYPRGQDVAWKWITAFVQANGSLELPREIGHAS